jgi:hypothetical protein
MKKYKNTLFLTLTIILTACSTPTTTKTVETTTTTLSKGTNIITKLDKKEDFIKVAECIKSKVDLNEEQKKAIETWLKDVNNATTQQLASSESSEYLKYYLSLGCK